MAEASETAAIRASADSDRLARATSCLAAIEAVAARVDASLPDRRPPWIDLARFEYVGPAKEVRTWPGFLDDLRARHRSGAPPGQVRRLDVAGDLAFVETEETMPDGATMVTMTVLAFTPDGKLCRVERFG